VACSLWLKQANGCQLHSVIMSVTHSQKPAQKIGSKNRRRFLDYVSRHSHISYKLSWYVDAFSLATLVQTTQLYMPWLLIFGPFSTEIPGLSRSILTDFHYHFPKSRVPNLTITVCNELIIWNHSNTFKLKNEPLWRTWAFKAQL